MFKSKILPILILGVGLAAGPAALSQNSASGSVAGTVHDSTGAVIPGANVTATNNATGIVTKVATTGSGYYTFPVLPIGIYTLDVTAPSFEHLQVQQLGVHVGSTIRQDATLTPGGVNTQINVTPTSQLLQTESAEVGQLVDSDEITQLPIVDRDIYHLLTLTAGAESGVNQANSADVYVLPGRPTIAGGRAGFTVFRVDGIDINNQNLPYASFDVSVDAVQEFRSVTALGDASESGDSSVDLVTKSGTNQFHGTGYEFFRNNALNAEPYFFVKSPPIPGFTTENNQLRYNEFGGTVGGPIWKDKTFFFGSVQILHDSISNQQHLIYPTAEELAGNYNGTFDPISDSNFGSATAPYPVMPGTATPYPGNQIMPGMYSALAQKSISSGFFIPSNCNACESIAGINADYIGNAEGSEQDTQYFGRIDHHFSDKDQLFGTVLIEPHNYPETLSPNPISATLFKNRAYEVNVSETHLFTQKLLNEFHLAYTRDFSGFGQYPNINAKGADVLANAPFSAQQNYLSLDVAGMSIFGNGGELGDSTAEIEDSIDLIDGVTWTHGCHVVKAGVEGIKARFFDILNLNGLLVYASDLEALGFTGNGFSDLETGLPFEAVAEQGSGSTPGVKRYIWDGYVQDTWKILPSLTLDYGLRYEVQGRWRDVDPNLNRLSTLDLSPASQALGGRFLLAGRSNYYLPGSGVVTGSGPALVGPTIVKPEYNDVMPRFGFAWQPFNSSQTVLRGGAGIYYPVEDANRIAMEINSAPFKFTSIFVNYPMTFTDATLFPAPSLGSPASEGENPNNRDPRVYEWTLSVDHQLGKNTLFSLDYVGNQGAKLPLVYYANQAPLPTSAQTAAIVANLATNNAAAQARTLFKDVSLTYLEVGNEATSSYNSLNATVQGQYKNRLNYTAVYTWSKALDIASSEQDSPMDTYDLGLSKGYSAFDHPQRFVGSWVYELPLGDTVWHLHNHLANSFISGWEYSGQATFEAGSPFSIVVGEDTSLRGDYPADVIVYPNLNGPLHKTNPRKNNDEYLTMQNLSIPAFGTLGNVHRNEFHGPGVNNFDMAVMKNIGLHKDLKLQLRAEAFNIFNHGQFVLGTVPMSTGGLSPGPPAPGSTLPTVTPLPLHAFAAVGQQSPLTVNGAPGLVSGSRIVQLAAKIIF